MGRDSRRKAERRRQAKESGGFRTVRQWKKAFRDEDYGRSVGSAVSDYEAAARRGEESLKSALISRHNQRMMRLGRVHLTLRGRARLLTNQLMGLEMALRRIGAEPDRMPASCGAGWIGQLAWGVDSIAAAIRLVCVGQMIGAGLIVRSQLERWALNVAYLTDISRVPGESTSSYYSRLWSALTEDGIGVLPEADRSIDGERRSILGWPIHPGRLYDDLSELLHGRGAAISAVVWESCGLLDPGGREDGLVAGNMILDLVEICIDRIRCCVVGSMLHAGAVADARAVFALSSMDKPAGCGPFPAWALWPLNPITGLSAPAVGGLYRALGDFDAVCRGERPAGRLYWDDEMAQLFFCSYRARAVKFARESFEIEEQLLGEPLELMSVSGRESRMVLVAETLALVSAWHDQEEVRHAATTASSALRSAFWLWLEDDNRAMGVLRVVLESISRLQIWYQNPVKAAKLEARVQTTPRDWLEGAGWRRLQALNTALGEMAHTRLNSRWDGAYSLLQALLGSDVDPELAPFRARGFALDSVIALAARVALDHVGAISEDVGAGMAELMDTMEVASAQLWRDMEKWFSLNWEHRRFDFGPGNFTTVTDEYRGLVRSQIREALGLS